MRHVVTLPLRAGPRPWPLALAWAFALAFVAATFNSTQFFKSSWGELCNRALQPIQASRFTVQGRRGGPLLRAEEALLLPQARDFLR